MKKLILILCLFTASCGSGEESDEIRHNLNGLGIPNTDSLPRNFHYTTPKGAVIDSVDAVPQSALEAIDRGLQRRVDRFKIIFPNWPAATSVTGTRLIFVRPNRTFVSASEPSPPCSLESIPGAPCLYIGGIKSAGTVLGTDDHWDKIDLSPVLVLPSQGAGNWQWLDYLAAAAHNEDEHRAGWLNRFNNPTGVYYHFLGANDAHPWNWGTDVPYRGKADELDTVIQSIVRPE